MEIRDYSLEELQEYFLSIGEKKYRALQLFQNLHNKCIESFDEITDIPKNLIQKLNSKFTVCESNIEEKHVSKDGTIKYLIKLKDANYIETVLMKNNYGYTQCISSQVGCAMGCTFCCSAKYGLIRNLTTAEMINQIYLVEKDNGITISNIVMMGSGEPFHNYDNVMKFLDILHHDKSRAMSYRKMTVSTCGLTEELKRFSEEGKPINLAISLHSANNEYRSSIMPINNKYNIENIIQSILYYLKLNNRKVMFEYALISGYNDTQEDVYRLIKLFNVLDKKLVHINLIPINESYNEKLKKPHKENINIFYNLLKKSINNVTIRRELGSDINAACGQLVNSKRKVY